MALEQWQSDLISRLWKVTDVEHQHPWELRNLGTYRENIIRRGDMSRCECPLSAIVNHETKEDVSTGDIKKIQEILNITAEQRQIFVFAADNYWEHPKFSAELRFALLTACNLL